MKIHIQNMVSLRCKMMVKSELENLGIAYKSIKLGEVLLYEPLTESHRDELKLELRKSGLDLILDQRSVVIEKIVNIIVEMVHYDEEFPNVNFSTYLEEKMNMNYHNLAEIFSKTKGITIEHFIILHKVERIKELIMYDELNLTEISYKLHYSSAAHLSRQFKQVTGLTPTFFKSLSIKNRKNLENL
jgi:AraC-like DNA-binding protein